MKKAALLSVSDKTGLVPFARGLTAMDFCLLASGGTAKHLREHDIEVTDVAAYTGQKEFLDGRVKTLHPKIHGGLLARQDVPADMKALKEAEIFPIHVAAVNLYPFEQHVQSETRFDYHSMIEHIDIGGPTMIRAAAKNHRFVYAVLDPEDYPQILAALEEGDTPTTQALRRRLSRKVFYDLARYNATIASYMSRLSEDDADVQYDDELICPPIESFVLSAHQTLRYGENPHQAACLYRDSLETPLPWVQHQGKALSYNNLLDFDAAARMVSSLPEGEKGIVIVKHCNPCGVATGKNLAEALEKARACDPRSHFGGIVASNCPIDADCAEQIITAFTEIVVAPSFDEEVLAIFARKKNIRVLSLDPAQLPQRELRSAAGGFLIQSCDSGASSIQNAIHVAGPKLEGSSLTDLQFAWNLVPHVRSNAVACVRDGMLLTQGGGQTSRIDALELALLKARTHGHSLNGAVLASDAFFPFPDCVEICAAEGMVAVIAPGGSIKDDDVIAMANEKGISLYFAEDRHFRH